MRHVAGLEPENRRIWETVVFESARDQEQLRLRERIGRIDEHTVDSSSKDCGIFAMAQMHLNGYARTVLGIV